MGITIGDALAGSSGAYGKYKSVHKRFSRWSAGRVWDGVFADLVKDRRNEYLMLDSTIVRAHQQAVTGRKKRASDAALGRSPGGLTTKIHLLADEHGLPVSFLLTGGHVHDCTQALPLLADRRPEALIADEGYDTEAILQHLSRSGTEAVIPPRSNRIVQRSFNKTLYKQRNRIERTFAHLKQFRRFATRFDRIRDNFKATVALTCAWLFLKL